MSHQQKLQLLQIQCCQIIISTNSNRLDYSRVQRGNQAVAAAAAAARNGRCEELQAPSLIDRLV
jgi:hypothetical protein